MTLVNQTKRVFKVLIPLILWFLPIILDRAKFLYYKMTDSEAKIPISNKAKRRKRKNSSDNVAQKKQSTIIERSAVSPNWQNFLKNQTKMDKKPKENDKTKKVDEEISAYWKQKRLEKKNITSPSQHLKRLNIDQDSHENNNESVKNKAELVKNIKKDEHYKNLIENPSNIEEVIQNNSYWKNKRLQKKNGGVVAPTKTILAANIEKQNKAAGLENTPTSASTEPSEISVNSATKPRTTLTKYVAIDCEMVGIGENMRESMLARVSLVNKFGDCIYDKFVKPREKVTDYRTPVSGIRKEDLQNGEDFEVVQKEVAEIIRNRFLVGHALKKDLEVLFLSHPKRKIRDTSKYKPFRRIAMGSTPSLKRLAKELLGVGIQGGEHSSVEDARATMQLYTQNQTHWEAALLARDRKNN